MKRHEQTAERIITTEGLTFALACFTCKEVDTARALLKERICHELAEEFHRGAELQRRSMEANALMDDLEKMMDP